MPDNLEESYSVANWYKTGLIWGILMFILTLLHSLLFRDQAFVLPDSLMLLLIWSLGGLGYGYGMHLYFRWRSGKKKSRKIS